LVGEAEPERLVDGDLLAGGGVGEDLGKSAELTEEAVDLRCREPVLRGGGCEPACHGAGGRARQLKGCRYALWKNPQDLTGRQAAKLAWIAKHNHQLYRAYLLKEHLRLVFQHRGPEAVPMLDDWLAWARRCQIPAFVELYHRIKRHRAGIVASVTHGLSNGLTESVNTKLRLITRMAYGFSSTDNLIALCLLDRGGYCPPLPGRQAA